MQKKTSDPRRIIFQGPKSWTLTRSREKKTGPSKTAPHPPHPFWEQEMGVASVAWRFLFKDCRPTLQYMTIHCWSFAGYDLYKSYIYNILYIFIHTFHYITLHYIPFHSWLVVLIILKNMSSSLGIMTFPIWQCVKTLYPCSSHQNSWDSWMFIPLKMVLIGIDPYPICGRIKAIPNHQAVFVGL